MNIHKKIGPFPVWAWGVAITGGIVLGIMLRRRAASSARQATADPNAALDALTNGSAFGMADPNSGLDSGGIISGLMQQQQDLLSYLLATSGGGGGSVPGISDPATYGPAASTPTSTSTPTATSTGAAPVAAVQPIDQPTYDAPPPPDPQYPFSSTQDNGLIDTGTQTSTGLPIIESPVLASNPDAFVSAATSSTGGVGGTGYLLLSDKTLRPSPGVNVMQ